MRYKINSNNFQGLTIPLTNNCESNRLDFLFHSGTVNLSIVAGIQRVNGFNRPAAHHEPNC